MFTVRVIFHRNLWNSRELALSSGVSVLANKLGAQNQKMETWTDLVLTDL